MHRLQTGIPDLDEMLGGGLIPGTLTVVCGATGIGKTQLGLQWTYQGKLQEGEPGILFDLTSRGDSQNHRDYAERLFNWTPTQQRPDGVCTECGGLGYKGQIALFELLIVDDLVRQTLLKDPKVDTIRAAARKAGMKTMEEEGLLQVVKGLTSVQELARVLKEGAAPAAPAAARPQQPPAAKK